MSSSSIFLLETQLNSSIGAVLIFYNIKFPFSNNLTGFLVQRHSAEELLFFLLIIFFFPSISKKNAFTPRDSLFLVQIHFVNQGRAIIHELPVYLPNQSKISKRHLRQYWFWGMAVIILVGIWPCNCKKRIDMKYSPSLIWGYPKYAEFIPILFLCNYYICFKSTTDLFFYPMLIIHFCICFLIGL